MSNFLTFGIVALAVGLASSCATRSEVKQVPYTVELRESVNGQEPELVHIYTYAMRSDGASVFKLVGPLGPLPETTRTVDLPDGISIRTNDAGQLKSSARTGNRAAHRDPNLQCVGGDESVTEEARFVGYRAVKLERGGRYGWYALDHGCAMLGAGMDWGGGEMTTKTLVQLTPGEPDPGLFDVPVAFREVPPSGLFPELLGSAEPGRALKGFDAQYLKNRP